MRTEIVVGCREHDGAVYFEQGLPILIAFLDISVVHSSDAFFSGDERGAEDRVERCQ